MVGRASHFVTPGSIRDMVLSPGTTLHRLLTDPADGRCREGNLQGLDTVVHALKTEKFWDAEIDASRTVTWTSLFGRHYRTRPHDYRQYLGLGDTAAGHHARTVQGPSDTTAGDHARTGQGPGHTIDIRDQGDHRDAPPLDEAAERRHLASLMVYAALAHRSRTDRLDAADDDPDSDAHLVDDGHRVVWVRQTRQRDGRRVTGPRPGTPTPDRLLDSSPAAVLRADHWTDPFTRRAHGANADSGADAGAPSESSGQPSTWDITGGQPPDESTTNRRPHAEDDSSEHPLF